MDKSKNNRKLINELKLYKEFLLNYKIINDLNRKESVKVLKKVHNWLKIFKLYGNVRVDSEILELSYEQLDNLCDISRNCSFY